MTVRSRRSAALALAVCALLLAAGVLLVRRAPPPPAGTPAVAAAPLVAVRDAAGAAGSPEAVRLQGTLVAMPPLDTPAGRRLALQSVEVGGGSGAPVAYRRALPAQLFLTDGDSLVALDAADVDPAFLPLAASGIVGDDGALPPDLRVHLAPGMAGLPREPGVRVAAYTIDATSPVLAYGRLVLQEGVPTLVAPSGTGSLVVTTMSADEVDRQLRRAERGALLLGWALIGAGALGALGAGVVALRQR